MRKTEKSGKQIAPGVWQLKTNEFLLRVQPKDPTTGKKRNVRRLLVVCRETKRWTSARASWAS